MSWNKLFLCAGLVLSLANVAPSQEAKCPSFQGKNRLVTVTVFDGPPEQRADLIPDVSNGSGDHARAVWDVGYIFDSGRGLFLVCQFDGGAANTVTVKVDKKVKRCTFRTHGATRPAEVGCK